MFGVCPNKKHRSLWCTFSWPHFSFCPFFLFSFQSCSKCMLACLLCSLQCFLKQEKNKSTNQTKIPPKPRETLYLLHHSGIWWTRLYLYPSVLFCGWTSWCVPEPQSWPVPIDGSPGHVHGIEANQDRQEYGCVVHAVVHLACHKGCLTAVRGVTVSVAQGPWASKSSRTLPQWKQEHVFNTYPRELRLYPTPLR